MAGNWVARKRRSVPMELPPKGTERGSVMCFLRNASVCRPASSRSTVEAWMAASSPLLVCISRTKSSIPSSACSSAATTMSGPSATTSRSSSVSRVAISTMRCRLGSSPVISRSIHASTGRHPMLGMVTTVSVQRLDPDVQLPAYARPGDAGADLVANHDAVVAAGGGRTLVGTGLAVAIPQGFAGFVLPRSGLALRHGITCLNTPGLVDAGYRGELMVLLLNTDPKED